MHLVLFCVYHFSGLEKGTFQENLGQETSSSVLMSCSLITHHCRSITHSILVGAAKLIIESDFLEFTYLLSE